MASIGFGMDALAGEIGDVPLDRPSRTTPLFVNPLMAMYFTFDLTAPFPH